MASTTATIPRGPNTTVLHGDRTRLALRSASVVGNRPLADDAVSVLVGAHRRHHDPVGDPHVANLKRLEQQLETDAIDGHCDSGSGPAHSRQRLDVIRHLANHVRNLLGAVVPASAQRRLQGDDIVWIKARVDRS